MVFPGQCLSALFSEDEELEYESRTQTKSTSTQTFYTASSVFSNLTGKPNNLRVFTVTELMAATNDFSHASKIGKGRYGSVYRGVVKSLEHPFDEIHVAVKHATGEMMEHRDLLAEVNFFGVVEHPNLVKLVGYCVEDIERVTHQLLVYEYMPNRSVKDHLSTRSETPLPWMMRLKVAQDTARGLSYLHEEMNFQILFRDFNCSNILLDNEWNAKLSDFVVVRIGPQEGDYDIPVESLKLVEYLAPEYILRGSLSPKSDVWSYGVFLYELITGRQALDRNQFHNEQRLLKWVRPYVRSKNFQRIIDPRLEGMYSLKSVHALAIIANRCLKKDPRSRPKMSEVLEMLNNLIGVQSQATSPEPALKSPVPVIRHSKLLKNWFRKVNCCVSVS